jgi:hypothetical protein
MSGIQSASGCQGPCAGRGLQDRWVCGRLQSQHVTGHATGALAVVASVLCTGLCGARTGCLVAVCSTVVLVLTLPIVHLLHLMARLFLRTGCSCGQHGRGWHVHHHAHPCPQAQRQAKQQGDDEKTAKHGSLSAQRLGELKYWVLRLAQFADIQKRKPVP